MLSVENPKLPLNDACKPMDQLDARVYMHHRCCITAAKLFRLIIQNVADWQVAAMILVEQLLPSNLIQIVNIRS